MRKVFRYLSIFVLLLVAVLLTAHFTWKYSGSGRWEKIIDKDGIRIYTQKIPGRTLRNIKAVRNVKTRLTTAMASMTEEGVNNCGDWFPGCVSAKNVVPYNRKDLSSTDVYVVSYPKPYSPREFILRTQIAQDPVSKAATMELVAVPNALPLHDCCYRISDLDNRWKFTPLSNGELNVEFIMQMDMGVPYPMINRMAPSMVLGMLQELPKHFEAERFQHAKLDFIKE